MNHRIFAQKTYVPAKLRRLLLPCLLLAIASLVSCSHKEPGGPKTSASPSGSPGAAPVVQLSPETSATVPVAGSPARKLFKTGEVVPAGYLGYKVHGSWFSDHLTSQDTTKQSATGTYLYVDVSVVNTDRKERPVGPFRLINEKGQETALSEKALALESSIGKTGKLASSLSKRAFAIFEVPRGHQYQLKLPGFTTTDSVLIELSPAEKAPAQ